MTELQPRFLTFSDHNLFVHLRVRETSAEKTTVDLIIEITERISIILEEQSDIKPRYLFRNLSNYNGWSYAYSEEFWVKAKEKIYARRRTIIQNTVDEKKSGSAAYLRDSLIEIQEWIENNVYEEVCKRNDFSVYTLFVASHEIVMDQSEPTTHINERKVWVPKHRIRIVLTSIAMSLYLVIMSLKPSVRNHIIVGSDSTFKLAIIKLLKVLLLALTWIKKIS